LLLGNLPGELGALVGSGNQGLQLISRAFGRLCSCQRLQGTFRLGAILQGVVIQNQSFPASGCFYLFIEPLPGFVSQQFVFQHLLEEFNRLKDGLFPGVLSHIIDIPGNMEHNVKTHHIIGAE